MTAEAAHILVVDDDTRLRELLRRYLSDNGFLVTTAADAADARAKRETVHFDLLVLDLMMPGENGLDFARTLREGGDEVPILMLTAMDAPQDRIAGLERGADDYLTKPFDPRELLLRITSILRRVPRAEAAPPPGPLRFGPISFDPGREDLRRDGRPVRITGTEMALLRTLAEEPGAVLSREDLAARTGAGGGRSVDVQVTRLRRKIEPDPRHPCYILTVRGQGYRLKPD